MAIFHLSMTIAKREGGKRSLIAMASYRSGEKLYSELYEKTNLYNHRTIKPEAFILKPDYVPDEFLDRQTLWNKMELAEKSPNAQLCRELNVALPIELNNSDQRMLIEDFVKDNFVSEGMIADVAIHRDDENNPHAHIMLTMREVDSEGNILNKRKRIPKLDENGNQIFNEKGQRVTVSIKTNDWDRKSLVSEIRKDWADKVNQYLKDRNIDQQITEKSHAELGKKELPTIHEGFYSKKLEEKGVISELKRKNLEIQSYNDILAELDKLESQDKVLKQDQNFTLKFEKTFSPLEKGELKNLSKELKLFINDENIDKRIGELKRWENSLIFNNKMEIQKQRLMLSKISSERDMLTKANEILDKQAERFFKKSYPSLNIDKFSNHEVRAMVNETIFRKQLLNKDQLAEVIYNERVVEKEESKKIFKEKPFQTSRYLYSKIKQVEDSITKENNPETKEILSIKKEKLIGIKQGLIEYVQSEVERKFDKNVSIDSVIEGEMLLAKADYYKTTDFSKVEGVARFSSEEINSMLEQSKGFLTNIQTVKIPNDCQGVFFVQDSMKYIDELSPLAKHNLKKVVNRNAYLPDSDKIELSKEIENTNKDQSQELDKDVPEKNEVSVKMFRFAKSINRLLSGNQPQKKRNLDKLIKQTKAKKNQSLQRNIPLR
ncbi:MobQ family relaxase [Lactococcus cremoris]|uniref:MobQ family relaxase n=1 Tax=Lactococcus lactis subsp. cremoris TaxID=1359 RepID=UPI002FCC3CE0